MVYFINVAEPYSGIYALTRSYYNYFKNNLVPSKWVNLHWDKNIKFDDEMIEFKHIVGSGYFLNNIINYIRPSYNIDDVKIYTDDRLKPILDDKEIMIIHDLFRQGAFIDRWKKAKILKILRTNNIGIIANSKFTASWCRSEGLRVISEFYPYYNYNYDSTFNKENIIMSVGTNANRKRPDLILKFINDLPEDWTFVRIGGDLSHVGNINTKAKYVYKDKVTAEELISYYNQSKYLFFPSESEGLGLPIIEALHHNVVVIANYKNPVLEEFNFTNLISKQKEGDFHIPEYNREDEFNIFKEWYRTQIKNQFKLILGEIEKMNDLQL